METNEKLDATLRMPCKNCGSEMAYNATKKAMLCDSCGHTQIIETGTDKIQEKSLESGLSLKEAKGLQVSSKTFNCTNCGAATAVTSETVNFSCGFCGSKNVNQKATEESRVISPEAIVPFVVDRKEATQKYKGWIGSGWFRPSNLAKMASMDKLHGVYIPFWTFDARTSSNWYADAGYHYYETEYYTDNEGKQQSREVQHTRWVPASGYLDVNFDDVLVIASQGVSQQRAESVMPFDLKKLVNYDSRFVLGWETELYKIDLAKGVKVGEDVMDNEIRNRCSAEVPGDTFRNLEVNTDKHNITYKHILLPIWISAFQYKGKTFQFVVNGQTGEISGEKPVAYGKVILAILAVIAIIAIIYFATQNNNH